MDPARSGVLLTWAVYAPQSPASNWIIQTCAPSDAVETLMTRFGLSETEARTHASGRFACATSLIRAGAPVFSDNSAIVDLAPMGPVANPNPEQPPVAVAIPGDPLAIYQSLPPPVDYSVVVPSERLLYHSALVEPVAEGRLLDLVGRRRVLIQGPDVWFPQGRWRCSLRLILEGKVGVTLLFEWAGADLEHTLAQSGIYEVSLESVGAGPVRADLRISLLVPVLDGLLTVQSMTIANIE